MTKVFFQCSAVYIGIAMGDPAFLPYISSFHFQFQFNLTSNDIKVENMSKSNYTQKFV